MDKQTYKEIKRAWRGSVYQDPSKPKMKRTREHLSELAGMRVLDIGCNAGVLSYDLSELVQRVIGVEAHKTYFAQLQVTARYMKCPTAFYCVSMKNFLRDKIDEDYNAAFASCVLYHLSPDEIELLEEIMLPKCKKVLFISRENKPRQKNPHKLHRWEFIKAWLERAGFEVSVPGPISNWTSVIGINPNFGQSS